MNTVAILLTWVGITALIGSVEWIALDYAWIYIANVFFSGLVVVKANYDGRKIRQTLSKNNEVKNIVKELNSYIHPKSIKKIKIDGKPVEHDVVRAINVYFITFMIVFSISVFAISFEGKDLVTNFTAVAATINNIGPGLELVGPTQNFGGFSVFSKYVLMFDMLAGRLELFPLLILLHPAVWKDLFSSKIKAKK